MNAPKCSYYTKNPTTGRDEQVCAEPVAEVWVERSSEEDEHGVSNPMRRYLCEGHGAKGELRKKKRLERVKEYPQLADDGLQYAIILKQFEVLPYGKTLPARTDEDRTAKPKTRLLQRLICEAFDLPIPEDESLQRMMAGEPCTPGCDQGCGK